MAILVLLMGATTARRNLDWKSDISLFSRAVQQEPDNAWAHAELGYVYYKKIGEDPGHLDLAEREFRTALSLDPTRQRLNTPMGSIRLSLGDYPAAIEHYSRALAAYPLEKEAMIFRAMAYEKLGRYREAIADYRLFLTTPGRKLTEMRPYAEARIRELTR